MPVIQATISQQILSLLNSTSKADEKVGKQQLADGLATIIVSAITSATVNPGIPVATAGGPTAQTGTTVGPGTLS
jgi:hypothetical protein